MAQAINPSLIFFCGHAGSGKTTLARRTIQNFLAECKASYCLLDKDTLYGKYSAAVMQLLTGNPDDRDSPLYLQHLREPEYQSLLDVAREQLALGIHVFVVGPLSREILAHQLIDRAWLGVAANVVIRIVWVHVDEAVAKQRIMVRGDVRDAYKLAHWDEYRVRRVLPSPEEFPELIFFDNTTPDERDYTRLQQALQS